MIRNLIIHVRPHAAEVALFTSPTGSLSVAHHRPGISVMLEMKLTGNVGTVRLVRATGKSPF